MDFKAKFKKSHYKSDRTYLEAVYQNNKQIIDSAFQDRGKPKVLFKQQVLEHVEQGKTLKEAIQTVGRTRDFTTAKEQFHANFYKGFKGYPLEYKQLRELTKVGGRYTKFDDAKLEWDQNAKGYVYDASYTKIDKATGKETTVFRKYLISMNESPKGINITTIKAPEG